MPRTYNSVGFKKDLTGNRYGRLTVLEFVGTTENRKSVWRCKCDCGGETNVHGTRLTNGKTQSCGCYKRERQLARSRTHGMSSTDEYRIYKGMLNRCYNRNVKAYPYYGGKGITVCDRWRFGENGKGGFECFYEDMGERPSKLHSLERDHGGKGYMPSNVRWATAKDQANNTSRNRYINVCDLIMSAADACEYFKADYSLVINRLQNGWDSEAAIFAPRRMRELDYLRTLSHWDIYLDAFYVPPQRRESPGLKEVYEQANLLRPPELSAWDAIPYKDLVA